MDTNIGGKGGGGVSPLLLNGSQRGSTETEKALFIRESERVVSRIFKPEKNDVSPTAARASKSFFSAL